MKLPLLCYPEDKLSSQRCTFLLFLRGLAV